MDIVETVKCKPTSSKCSKLRDIACQIAVTEWDNGSNPLVDTQFNTLLEDVVQQAFDAGRNYEKRRQAK